MRVLVTGGAGFVARHLRNELAANGHEVILSDVIDKRAAQWSVPTAGQNGKAEDCHFVVADLTDASAMRRLVAETRPDGVIHLGAISFVPEAAKDPELLQRINVGGTENLINAVAQESPHARFLFVSTAQVMLKTPSAYAQSKLSAEKAVAKISEQYGLTYMIARPSNHTGPGQSEKFVVPGFVKQALEIKDGIRQNFTVGNLDSIRDFTDVRDVATAYRLILERGNGSETYPIVSDQRMTIGDLLNQIAACVGVPIHSRVDQSLWRPTDASMELDCSKIKSLGWVPRFPLSQTIQDMQESMGS